MRPDEMAAYLREQQRQAQQRTLQQQRLRAQEEENRRANARARQRSREEAERLRRYNEDKKRQRDSQRREEEERTRKRARQPSPQHWPEPFRAETAPQEEATSGDGESRGGGFFKAGLIVFGILCVIGYLGSRSGYQPSGPVPGTNPVFTSQPVPSSTNPLPVPPPEPVLAPTPEVSPGFVPPDSPGGAPAASPQEAPSAPAPQVQEPVAMAPEAPAAPTLQVLSRVAPVYPELARASQMYGTVTVVFRVTPDGSVAEVFSQRGNPILAKAALDAARQWRFAPYPAVPGQPYRTTTVNFNFAMQ
jgi:TonB family protein